MDAADDSIKSTRGSSLVPPINNEEEAISPEELTFTEVISKAISKQLAPLIANRNQTRARPTVYEGIKDGIIDGWLLLMKRFVEGVHTKSRKNDRAWAITHHLEGEARNYMINKSEPERDELDKVFTWLASRFGTSGNRMQVQQISCHVSNTKKKDWMQV